MKFEVGQGVEYKSAIWTIEKVKEEAQTAVIANPDRRFHEKKNVRLSELSPIKEAKKNLKSPVESRVYIDFNQLKPPVESQVCIECEELKPVEEFSWLRGKTKRNPRCKVCASSRARAGIEKSKQETMAKEVKEVVEKENSKQEVRLVGDQVKHPSHYQGTQGLEVIDIMKNFLPKYQDGYVAGMIKDVIKYILRAPSKGNLLQDLKKAREYLNFAIEYLEAS